MFRTHQENKPENISVLTRFLWWCSGAHVFILEETPTDKIKYEGIGGVVLATAFLAVVSSTYALNLIFDNLSACLLFGFAWGLIIFNLDRYLVSTIEKRGYWCRELLLSVPRFALAIVIAIVVSHPLKLKIFEKEIAAELLEKEHQLYLKGIDERIGKIKTEQEDIDTELNKMGSKLDEANIELNREVQGRFGTGLYGRGTAAITIEQWVSQRKREYEQEINRLQPRRNDLETQLAKLEEEREQKNIAYSSITEKWEISARKFGILDRIRVLSELEKSNESVYYTNLFISILFVLLEVSPVLSKLITQAGAYDVKLEVLRQLTEKESGHLFETKTHYYNSKIDKDKELADVFLEKITNTHKEDVIDIIDEWKESPDQGLGILLKRLYERIVRANMQILQIKIREQTKIQPVT